MPKYFTIAIAIFFTTLTYAQMNIRDIVAYTDFTNVHSITYSTYEGNFLDEIEGSLYLKDDIKKGYFIDTVLKNKVDANLRYDAYNDVFKIYPKHNNEKFKLLERTKRFEYELDNEKFVLIETDLLNVGHFKHGKGYVVELTSPNANAVLYKRYYKKLDSGSVAASSYETDTFPSLNSELFYIIKLNGEYVKADAHKKKVLKSFSSEKRNEIKRFIESNKLKFRGTDSVIEDQMVQVVRYYNSL